LILLDSDFFTRIISTRIGKYHALKMVRDLLTARGEESKPSQNFRVGMQDIIL